MPALISPRPFSHSESRFNEQRLHADFAEPLTDNRRGELRRSSPPQHASGPGFNMYGEGMGSGLQRK
jgi:hypothetical protein